ncbi:MAG: SUMF1/EgtB/PvdO family nonheme iron enzyme [Nitrospinae bacterium]|nr:SUMF1/EgtB/PvdO family nonheme iron enzyme [Nitrospinota bacterium]MDA1109110.1 SUMF1/EgtB/PvdO family nonheme iron enzyme [Nitrospinota bacterium]
MKSHSTKYIIKVVFSFLLTIFIGTCLPIAAVAESSAPQNMVLINPGGFIRGIDKTPASDESKEPSPDKETKYEVSKDAFDDEGPAQMIYLSAYYIDKYEISNAHYTEFIKATDYPAPAYWDHRQLNQPNQPVTGVNWYDANAYCHWANKRLPTEAEWEKAARGPGGSIYPWGNELDYSKANFAKGKTGQKHITAPIDSHPEGKSYYGVYNMAGNVFEWVQDWYDPNYYKTSKDISNPAGPQIGGEPGITGTYPDGLAAGKKKVIRGGSWFAPQQSITTTHRFWNDPMNNSYGVGLGFRCARDVESDSQMQARSFYMLALIHLGNEKYKEALASINKALETSPDNKEYQALKVMIEEQGNI